MSVSEENLTSCDDIEARVSRLNAAIKELSCVYELAMSESIEISNYDIIEFLQSSASEIKDLISSKASDAEIIAAVRCLERTLDAMDAGLSSGNA